MNMYDHMEPLPAYPSRRSIRVNWGRVILATVFILGFVCAILG